MGSFYEGIALQVGKGFAMAEYAYSLSIIPAGGRIQAILCAALFSRGGDFAVCTDRELIYVLQASVFARCQVIPFLAIEALEMTGRSIFITFREPGNRGLENESENGPEESAAKHHELLKEEHLSILCLKADMLQLYRHILQRWRASGSPAALDRG